MLRQRLAICIALSAVACAQIAGFKELSPKQSEDGGSAGVAGDGNGTKAGGGTGAVSSGGTEAVEAMAGDDAGGSATNTAGRKATGGVAGSAGSTSTGGSTSIAGSPSTGGNATAGTTSTAGAGGSVDDQVIGGCNAEQLRNGSFDYGPTPTVWKIDSSASGISEASDVILHKSSSRLGTAKVAPVLGDYLAWLGSQSSSEPAHITLYQVVNVPTKVSKLVLSGSIRIRSAEPDLADTADQIDLALVPDNDDDTDNRYWSFKFWAISGNVATDKWIDFEYSIDEKARLDELRGQTWRFKAESQADTQYDSTYWLDSLSLTAVCP